MSARPPRSRRLPKVAFVLVLAAMAGVILYAVVQNSDWKIPEGAKSLKNPVVTSPDALRAARDLYRDECAHCHGDTGKGDGPDANKYKPAPADLTEARHMQPQSDGELFYKITGGKRPMPAFKKRLTDEQRWQLVLMLRAFIAKANTSGEPFDSQRK